MSRNGTVRTWLSLSLVCLAALAPAVAGSVNLLWNPSSGATGYKVYWDSNSGAPYASSVTLGNVTQTTISTMPDCAATYFAVTAFNSLGESAYSNEISSWPRPTITTANPAQGTRGQSLSVVLSGNNFQPGATLQLTGVTVNSFTRDACGQITASISIPSTASVGPVPISVTNAGGVTGTASAAFCIETCTPPVPPPVAAWSFNEGTGTVAADATGGNNGTVTGATWTTQGRYSGALSFDGAGDLVSVPDAAELDLTSAMTLEAWVYPTASAGDWSDVIFKAVDIYYLEGDSPSGTPAVGGSFAGSPLQGTSTLPLNTWTHVAATYDRTTLRLYVNGNQVASRALTAAIPTSSGALSIGGDATYGQYWTGRIDEVRVYNVALTATQIQTDMAAAIGSGGGGDTTAPTVSLTAPASGATVSGSVTVSANASDNVGVVGVQFLLDGNALGTEDTTSPYSISWDSTTVANGSHTLSARARDAAGNTGTAANRTVTVSNSAPLPDVQNLRRTDKQ